jgi:hypothetical protein
MRSVSAAMLGLLAALGACGSREPPPSPVKVQANVPLAPSEALGRATMIYRNPNLNVRQYVKFIVDPVAVYAGTDADWGGASEEEVRRLAAFLKTELIRAIGDRYAVVTVPGPDVARMKLTLAGMQNNEANAAVSTILPPGLLMNAADAAQGREGSFTGSVTIEGEIIDSRSNQPVVVFVQRRGPDAMDFGAAQSDRDAQRAAITSFADAFRDRVDEIQEGRGETTR